MKRTLAKKLTTLLFVTLVTAFTLTGCMPSFDASGYIKACLDANTKGEAEAYAELTGASIEEVEALYEQNIDTEMAYVEAYNVSDEKKEEFRTLFIDMYKNFKYEVGEATKNDDGSYSVPVTTYKLHVFEGVMTDGEAYLMEYAEAEMEAGNTPTQEQLEEEALNFMYTAMKENLDALVYDEGVSTTIKVSPTKNGKQVVYSASQTDLQALMTSLIDIENAQ